MSIACLGESSQLKAGFGVVVSAVGEDGGVVEDSIGQTSRADRHSPDQPRSGQHCANHTKLRNPSRIYIGTEGKSNGL